jgi:hypothetical protein
VPPPQLKASFTTTTPVKSKINTGLQVKPADDKKSNAA